jgi:hypothetical protein
MIYVILCDTCAKDLQASNASLISSTRQGMKILERHAATWTADCSVEVFQGCILAYILDIFGFF